MSPKVVNKDEKRAHILRAALPVFAHKGVNNVKMIDIATAAAVGKGTLYEYFPSKEDLIVGAFTLFADNWSSYLNEQINSLAEPAEIIGQYIRSSLEFFKDNRQLFAILSDMYAAGIPREHREPLFSEFGARFETALQKLSSVIQEGIDQKVFRAVNPREVASIIFAALDGILSQSILNLIEIDSEAPANSLIETLLKGILVDSK
ncbi:MAG: TetR/AcrR family transcriptional regulator [Candidatus Zixiibacteriota bacterium]|nr:MAG: TetR/AcrR family transcriptional regulator [candidate division Zixibacteria bacterium]